MKTRILALVLILFALPAGAQVGKWDTVSYEKWGFALQLPSGSVKQAVEGQPESGVCDLYQINGLACIVKVTPTQDTQLSSTVIEQAIQAEVKSASALGPPKRWEQDSKQGDLFKGYSASVQLKAEDPMQAAVGKIVGEKEACESISMASLGDDTSPVLRITVIGPKSRQAEVVTTAKGIAAFMTKTVSADPGPVAAAKKLIPELKSEVKLAPKPKPQQVVVSKPRKLVIEPRPQIISTPKRWPTIKKGEIELAGSVTSIAPDCKTMILCVDSVIMPGQAPITLSPVRSKKVMLRYKLDWLAVGQRVRIMGKNTGIGKPMTADAVEQLQKP